MSQIFIICVCSLAKIFNAYTQLDGAVEKSRGTGLGLVLVKQFTELHDGHVNVTSALGKGTQFTVCIPVKADKVLFDPALQQDQVLA